MRRRRITRRLEWLDLLEISGPFLSPPVIDRVFPQGLDVLDTDQAARLRLARDDWADHQRDGHRAADAHTEWIRLVLTDTLEFTREVFLNGEAIPSQLVLEVPEYDLVVRPDFAVAEPASVGRAREARLLVHVYAPDQDLDGPVRSSPWAATPASRMTQLCRATGVRLGLVTNGERWMLVDAPAGETSAYVSWYASLFSEEPDTLRAFRSLLGTRRFFGVDPSETLEEMLTESASYQADVTEQLGAQVRRAIEVLVRALDRADADTGRQLLAKVGESELYEAAITVMMRLVFLFFAEESGLLLLGDETYDQFYSASMLRGQLREEADRVGLEVLERRQDAWSRLLATFRGIYAGIDHDALHLPAYGGSLFDPDRFTFLEGRVPGTSWVDTDATPLPIDNRTVLHLLDALQVLQMGGRGGEARKLSFRALDIEQIGHVYESLLDHVAVRASAPMLGLVGPRGAEPEVSLDDVDAASARGSDALLEFLADRTKKSKSTVTRALDREVGAEVAERLSVACADEDVLARLLPYAALIRDDPWGEPIVVRAGSIFITAGPERRGTGTYYTPRALTEEVVTNALEPLAYQGPAEGKPRDEWELKTPGQLLDLKICDLAMGSGAFLVQACRWLGERLVESWEKAGADDRLITTTGRPGGGDTSEMVIPADPEERRILARRLIADRCLYGVDVNPLAVEMAKLSMWLMTLGKGRPFSFLDHALKCGDSLLGVHDLDQLRHFHVDPARGREIHATLFDPSPYIESTVEEALRLRRELEAFTVLDVRDAKQKAKLHEAAEEATQHLRMLGDLLMGATLATADSGVAALDERLLALAQDLHSVLDQRTHSLEQTAVHEARAMLDLHRPATKPTRRPFHWPLEFPEVFSRDSRGFDAVVGNPPFKGGQHLTGLLGTDYREYLVEQLAAGRRGSADLVTYFVLRAASLARTNGCLGLLATNTISQGDTRQVGLDWLLQGRWTVIRAWKSRRWPGDASVTIAELWLHAGPWSGPVVLDGALVSKVSSSLDPASRVGGPAYRLNENAGRSFQGPVILGKGFLLSPDEAESLMVKDQRNREVLFPYLSGDDLNSSPTQSPSRWVINFFDWPLERAEQYPECLAIVRDRVKPERDVNTYSKHAHEHWWQYHRLGVDLKRAVSGLPRVIALTRHSNTITPAFVAAGIVYGDALTIFAYDDYHHLGLLTSGFHVIWSMKYASTLQTGLRYTPSDCFETFPQPLLDDTIATVTEQLSVHRDALMRDRNEGLTQSYRRLNDAQERSPELDELRRLHVELDRSVAGAYGCDDLALDHDFYDTPQGVRYTLGPSTRVEVLDRLLELNQDRHRRETGEPVLALEETEEAVRG